MSRRLQRMLRGTPDLIWLPLKMLTADGAAGEMFGQTTWGGVGWWGGGGGSAGGGLADPDPLTNTPTVPDRTRPPTHTAPQVHWDPLEAKVWAFLQRAPVQAASLLQPRPVPRAALLQLGRWRQTTRKAHAMMNTPELLPLYRRGTLVHGAGSHFAAFELDESKAAK